MNMNENMDGRGVKILIVEDSLTQALKLRHTLKTHGFEVAHARNGSEALEQLKTQAATLVISDINMPEMDGYQLCQRIRADEQLKDLPLILLTSLSDPTDVISGLQSGADN